MAYASYNDIFHKANPTGTGTGIVYNTTISGPDGPSSGTISNANPIEKAMTRNLGDQMVMSIDSSGYASITIEVENTNITGTTYDEANYKRAPLVIGVLNHNILAGPYSGISVTYHMKNGVNISKTLSTLDTDVDKFNNAFFVLRERFDDVCYKVSVFIIQTKGAHSQDIKIGRLWVGGLWDLGTPEFGRSSMHPDSIVDDIMIMEGRRLGLTQGSETELSIGNQSYIDGAKPLKTSAFDLVTRNDNETFGYPDEPLSYNHNALDFVNHLAYGGECIVVPRDTNNYLQDYKMSARIGIYGELSRGQAEMVQTGANEWTTRVQLRELI